MKNLKFITFIAISIFFPTFLIDCPAKGEKTEDTLKIRLKQIYYVDKNEADQGVSGAGNSVKDLVDIIGMSKEAVFILSHNPDNGDTTTYSFSTDMTFTSNIILEFEKGALLNIGENVTISIYSPENISAFPKHRIKSGGGAMIFLHAGTIYPGWWGTPSDGHTDSTSYWIEINRAIQDDSTIELLPNAGYYINTSGGLIFSKRIRIEGCGARFICGPSVENNPTITISASKGVLEDFEVDCSSNHFDMTGDNDFQDRDDNFFNNHRRAVKICGDYVACLNLNIKTAVVGISYEDVTGGEIHNCALINSIVRSNTPNANNYHAGILIDDSTDIVIYDNYIDGYGQNIIMGGSHKIGRIRIYGNNLTNASNNGIYVSSGTDMQIWDNDVMSFDCTGIKVRDSYHNVHHNRIYCDVPYGSISGITITGNGHDDGDGFNGRDSVINSNIITGNATAGIISGAQNGFSMKNPRIINNIINFDLSPSKPAYSIFFKESSSDGAVISGNLAAGGHTFGLLMNAGINDYHHNAIITNNSFIGGTNEAFALTNLQDSIIANNQCKNSASKRSGLMLYNSIYNKAYNNDFGDDQTSPTQEYGVEEQGSSDYNEYLNNHIIGVIRAEYYGLGLNSKIIDMDEESDPNYASSFFYSDGYLSEEGYIERGISTADINDYNSLPYVDITNCHPFAGQGILPDSLRVPIDTSIVVKLKDDTGIDENSIMMAVNGIDINPVIKKVNGSNRDYWIVYNPAKDFDFGQIVNVAINASDLYKTHMNTYEYSFRVESQSEYNIALENTPSFNMDESYEGQDKLIACSGTEIQGAIIIHDPSEPVKPRFGPLNELSSLDIINTVAVGCPLSLNPPTVFNNPVTVFIPCPGINDLSVVKIYFYNPVIGWIPSSAVDGWMISDSRVNHPETSPPTIEIRINYSGIIQAGIPLNSKGPSKPENVYSIDGDGNKNDTGAGKSGCFIDIISLSVNIKFPGTN